MPEVGECVSFAEAVRMASESDLPLFLYESEQENSLRAVLTAHSFASAALMVGPEGGFADEEARDAVRGGLASVSLGPRILRCETAPCLLYTSHHSVSLFFWRKLQGSLFLREKLLRLK